jgi:hypothetical protein
MVSIECRNWLGVEKYIEIRGEKTAVRLDKTLCERDTETKKVCQISIPGPGGCLGRSI